MSEDQVTAIDHEKLVKLRGIASADNYCTRMALTSLMAQRQIMANCIIRSGKVKERYDIIEYYNKLIKDALFL